MNERLQILITAGLNEGLSIGEINKGLKKLAKHPSLQKLRVSVEIDKRVLDQLSKLSSELSKSTNVINQQRSVSEQTKKTVNDMTVALDKETASINQNTEAMRKNAEMQRKITEGADFIRTDTTTGSRFNRVTTSETVFFDEKGNVAERVTHPKVTVTNYESYREAQKQLQVFTDDANKRIQMLSRTFGEGSEEIIRLKNSIAQLTPEASRADYSKITNQIKELERSERLLNQAYKENELFNVRRQKDIDAVTNRINNLRTEMQKFNRAGKELPVGKGQELDKAFETLNKLDPRNITHTTQELDKLEKTFRKLDKTASSRTSLLNKLDSLKLTGVIDEGEISRLESRVRKAESPEQIKRLAKEYGQLYAQQTKILQVDQKLIPLQNELQQMRQRGLLTEKELLNFEERIANAKTKNHIKELNQIKTELNQKETAIRQEMNLEQQNAQLRERINQRLLRMELNPLMRSGRHEIERYKNELNRLNLTSATTNTRMREIENSLKRMQIELTGTTYKTSTLMGAFQNAIVKFPIWMGASTLFFGTVRGIRSALDNIIEIDSQMTTLMRVSNGEIDRAQILKESGDLAARLGNEMKAVNESFTDFARQGFRGEGLTALTEAATLFSNISEMTPEEASSGLTAIIKGFDMLPEHAMVAIDAINEVDNNFAYSSQNIVSSITKSVGAAQAFGVDLQELIGYTTAIGEVTRESGNIIGNSLKTIFSRIATMDSSIEVLESIGVSVHEIRDGVESVRPVADILEDLAAKWGSLSEEQQQNIGLQIAGRFQLSRFLVLMQQFDTAIKATNTALNSQGSGYRENEQYLKSLEARINMLKNAWTELTLTMGDAVLTDVFIGIVNTLTKLANGFGKLIDQIGLLPSVLGLATGAYVSFSSKSKAGILSLATAIRGKNVTLMASTAAIHRWSVSMVGAGASARALTVAVRGLSLALRSLLIATGVGAAVAVVGLALEGLINHFSNAKEEAKKFREENERLADSFINNRNSIEELLKTYQELDELRNNTKLTAEQEEKYFETTKKLSDILPSLVSHIDERGRVYLLNGDALEREIELTEKLAEATAELRRQEALENFIQNEQKREAKLDEIAKKEAEIVRAQEKLNQHYANRERETEFYGEPTAVTESYIKEYEMMIRKLRQELIMLQVESHRMSVNAGEYFKSVLDLTALVSDVEFSGNFKSQMYQIIDAMDLTEVSISDLDKAAIDIIDLLKDDSLTNEGFIEGLKEIYKESPDVLEAIDSVANAFQRAQEFADRGVPVFNELDEIIGYIGGTSKDTEESFINLRQETNELGDSIYVATSRIDGAASKINELQDNFNSFISTLTSLREAYDTLNEGQQLSLSTIQNLIKEHPQLLSALRNENGQLTLNKDAVEMLMRAEETAFKNGLRYRQEELEDMKKALLTKFSIYSGEIEALEKLDKIRYMSGAHSIQEAQRLEENFNEYKAIIDELEGLSALIQTDFSKYPVKTSSTTSSSSSSASRQFIPYEVDEYANAIANLSLQVEQSQYRQASYNQISEEYRKELEEQIRLYKEMQVLTEQEANRLRARNAEIERQLQSGKLSKEQISELTREMDKNNQTINNLSSTWLRYGNNIRNALQSIQSAADEQKRLNEENERMMRENHDAWRSNLEKAADEAISAIKKHYEQRKKLALDAIDKELDALEKLHQKQMDMLDKELKQYEEIVNAQLKAIDRQADEEDFNRELAKAEEERLELQKRINVLQLDDSLEARAKRQELEQELAKKIEEIELMKNRRTKDLRKQNLQDFLEDQRKRTEEVKNREQEQYEAQKEAIQRRKEAEEQYWQDLIDNDRYYNQLREEALNGNIKNLTAILQKFAIDVEQAMTHMGKVIDENLAKFNLKDLGKRGLENIQDTINDAIDNLDSAFRNKTPKHPNVGSGNQEAYNKALKKYIDNKIEWYEISKTNTSGEHTRRQKELNKENEQLRKEYHFPDWTIEDLVDMGLASLDSGGMTPSWGKSGKLGVLHENEIIFNKIDSSKILEAARISENIIRKFSPQSLSKLMPNVITNRSIHNDTRRLNIQIFIDKLLGTKKGGEDALHAIVDGLKSKGIV